MRSKEGKTYGKTASGKLITDALVEELFKKAEAGYEVDEVNDRAERLCQLAKRLRSSDGLDVDARHVVPGQLP